MTDNNLNGLLEEVKDIYPDAVIDEDNEVFLCDINDRESYLSLCIDIDEKTEYNLYINNYSHNTYDRISTTKSKDKIINVLKSISECKDY